MGSSSQAEDAEADFSFQAAGGANMEAGFSLPAEENAEADSSLPAEKGMVEEGADSFLAAVGEGADSFSAAVGEVAAASLAAASLPVAAVGAAGVASSSSAEMVVAWAAGEGSWASRRRPIGRRMLLSASAAAWVWGAPIAAARRLMWRT